MVEGLLLVALINPFFGAIGGIATMESHSYESWTPSPIDGLMKGDQFEVVLPKYNGLDVDLVKREFGEDFKAYFKETYHDDHSVHYTMMYDSRLCNRGAIESGMKFSNAVGVNLRDIHTTVHFQEVVEVPKEWFKDNGCNISV